MGNQVKALREKKNLTQNELAEKAKLSLRTVQRIEAGNALKGFTLNSLALALESLPEELLIATENPIDISRAKMINLSALCGLIFPFGGVIVSAILTYRTKDPINRELGKHPLYSDHSICCSFGDHDSKSVHSKVVRASVSSFYYPFNSFSEPETLYHH
jgi:transcriptional regulator with XRE-family HTH domain